MATIRRIEAFAHSSPIDPPRVAGSGPQREFAHIVVRVTDSDGAVGYGECVPIPAAIAMLEAVSRQLLGTDPLAREYQVSRVRTWFNHPFPVSALSIALDDLIARRLDISVATLYGGPFRHRVQPYGASYGSLPGKTLESWIDEAEGLIARGFPAMKLRLGVLPVADECRALEALRARLPASLALMADGNGGFNTTTAREMGRCAQEVGLLWFEEPLPLEGYVGYPELAQELTIPLAGGELSLTRPATFELLSRRAVDIIQPDPVACGGVGETIFVGALARLFGRLCVPHTSGGAIGVAAGIHALACLPDQSLLGQNQLLFLEYPALVDPVQRAIAPNLLEPKDGWIEVPTAPGLGIDIDDDAVERLASQRMVVE
jgi:D-galactarolactone cycloisomerase